MSKKNILKICEICNISFFAYNYRAHKTKYCSIKCLHKSNTILRSGSNSKQWSGGRIYNAYGYVLIFKPEHPFASKTGYVREHRLVMEKHINRILDRKEHVHHINSIKDDNRIENLKIVSASEHGRIHKKIDAWSIMFPSCISCNTTERRHNAKGLCYKCYKDHLKKTTGYDSNKFRTLHNNKYLNHIKPTA